MRITRSKLISLIRESNEDIMTGKHGLKLPASSKYVVQLKPSIEKIVSPSSGKFNYGPNPDPNKLKGALNDIKTLASQGPFKSMCKKLGSKPEIVESKASKAIKQIDNYSLNTFINLFFLQRNLFSILKRAHDKKLKQLNKLNPKLKTAYNMISSHVSQVTERAADQKISTGSKEQARKNRTRQGVEWANRLSRVFDEEVILRKDNSKQKEDEVKALQEYMLYRMKQNGLTKSKHAKAFMKYGADGDFGNATKNMIAEMQQFYKIQVDGEAGGQFVRALEQNRKPKVLRDNNIDINPTKKLKKPVDESASRNKYSLRLVMESFLNEAADDIKAKDKFKILKKPTAAKVFDSGVGENGGYRNMDINNFPSVGAEGVVLHVKHSATDGSIVLLGVKIADKTYQFDYDPSILEKLGSSDTSTPQSSSPQSNGDSNSTPKIKWKEIWNGKKWDESKWEKFINGLVVSGKIEKSVGALAKSNWKVGAKKIDPKYSGNLKGAKAFHADASAGKLKGKSPDDAPSGLEWSREEMDLDLLQHDPDDATKASKDFVPDLNKEYKIKIPANSAYRGVVTSKKASSKSKEAIGDSVYVDLTSATNNSYTGKFVQSRKNTPFAGKSGDSPAAPVFYFSIVEFGWADGLRTKGVFQIDASELLKLNPDLKTSNSANESHKHSRGSLLRERYRRIYR